MDGETGRRNEEKKKRESSRRKRKRMSGRSRGRNPLRKVPRSKTHKKPRVRAFGSPVWMPALSFHPFSLAFFSASGPRRSRQFHIWRLLSSFFIFYFIFFFTHRLYLLATFYARAELQRLLGLPLVLRPGSNGTDVPFGFSSTLPERLA